MGESDFFDIRDKLVSKFPKGEETLRIRRVTSPGARMNFINRHRLMVRLALLFFLLPRLVIPLIAVDIAYNRGGIWTDFTKKLKWIRFFKKRALSAF